MGENGSADDWVTESATAARAEYDVPDGVVTRLQRELRGAMSQRALRPNEQGVLARELIAAMTPAKADESQECD